jgi:hypothetical protein
VRSHCRIRYWETGRHAATGIWSRAASSGRLMPVVRRSWRDQSLTAARANIRTGTCAYRETILRAYLIRRSRLIERGAGMRIIGSCYDADTRRLLEFATRNRLPHRWIDLEKDPDADVFLRRMKVDRTDTPVVIFRTGKLMRNPSNSEVAAELGILVSPNHVGVCDLLVVGAGPAGLAASVYGASDGLTVTTVECRGGRRPGQYHFSHRELPRFSRRHLRRRADRTCRRPGRQIRCPRGRAREGDRGRAGRRTLSGGAGQFGLCACPRGRRRVGGALSAPRRARNGQV